MAKSFFLTLLLFLFGCSNPNLSHDPSMSKTREDFFELLKPAPPLTEKKLALQTVSKTMHPQKKETKISINVQEETSVQVVFKEIANQAGMGIIMDPNIDEDIIYTATNQTISQAIDAICTMKNLRGEVHNNMLHIQKNTPYMQSYSLTFLALSRETTSAISTNTSVIASTGVTQDGNQNGSTSTLKSSGTSDLWQEIETNISRILAVNKDRDHGDGLKTTQASDLQQRKEEPFTINRHAGIVTIYAHHQDHKIIAKFLETIKKALSAQILIEAKVVEVSLKDEFRSGINWDTAFKGALNFKGHFADIASTPTAISNLTAPTDVAAFTLKGGDLTSVLDIMDSFGSTRTLSSPRLTVLNNQTAVMKVAENKVFFRVKYDRQISTTRNSDFLNNTIASSTIETVPVGFIMSVHPAIDPETRDIILTLRPTITRVVDMRSDPAVKLISAQENLEHPIQSEIPIIAVREIDSVLRMHSGQIAVLGGLMQEGSMNTSSGIPGTDETPFSFFTRSKVDNHSVTELVIFLKATIIDAPQPDASDKRLYEEFTHDPRILDLS